MLLLVRCFKELEHKLKVVISLLFLHLSSTVSKETETTSYTNTHTNLPDTQVSQCLLSSLTANQPVTRQTPQAPGKENMLFFWASLNFTAYKTRPHGAHPTHAEIKAPSLSLETNSYPSTPAEPEVRIHEQAPKVQAH